MISRDIRIEHLDERHLANLVRAMDPPEGRGEPEAAARPRKRRSSGLFERLTGAASASADDERDDSGLGAAAEQAKKRPRWRPPVVALTRAGRVLRLFRLGGGTLPRGTLRSADPEDLKRFRRKHELPFVVAVDVEALPRLYSQVQKDVRVDDDMVAQQLAMLRAVRAALDGGEVVVEPRLIGALPIPSYDILQKSFDLVLPDGRSALFYIVDGHRIWTSAIVHKEKGDVSVLTSHRAIADEVELRSIKTDAPRVVEAVTRRYGPVHVGFFVTLHTWHAFVSGDRGAIARALATRTAVLDPCPPWLFALVGAGAVSEAASRSARLAGRLLSRSRFLSSGAGKLVQSMTSPLEVLGVDPWELMKWAQAWSRRVLPLI
ncbi:MAG: hypothetical protein KC503_08780 [Myxococcales bacterium]|nr:hypothetical protein [Myxococcales bacterium]